MRVPRPVQRLIESFERLPGIGPKTAARLTYYLLPFPENRLQEFADALIGIKRDIKTCQICFNIGETNPCAICADRNRDRSAICVVEHPLDLVAIENTGQYHGLYHVLHGIIDPLHHIGPDDIYLPQLLDRIKRYSSPYEGEVRRGHLDKFLTNSSTKQRKNQTTITELILALNPTMEGEATSIYIKNQIHRLKNNNIQLTRLAQGLSLGSDLEYADTHTLSRAIQGRGAM